MLGPALVLLMVATASADVSENRQIRVSRRILNSGFHRIVETVVTGAGPLPRSVLIQETLPNGMYSDPYELSASEFALDTQALFASRVDVEAPAERSDPLRLLVFARTTTTATTTAAAATANTTASAGGGRGQRRWSGRVSLPVHLRYHAPAQPGQPRRRSVSLPTPIIMLPCDGDGELGCSVGGTVQAPCSAANESLCLWRNVSFVTEDEGDRGGALVAWVPVGSLDHVLPVFTATVGTALACCVVLMHAASKTRPQ